MFILFDQGTPLGLRRALQGHTVKTAYEQGWSTMVNGELLRAAESAGFEVFITTDTNLLYQQNLKKLKLAIIILSRNRWRLVKPHISNIIAAVEAAQPGSCRVIDISTVG